MKIVICDQDKAYIEQMKGIMQEISKETGTKIYLYCFKDPQSCIEYMEKEMADLIVLEMRQPDMTGIELAQKLRNVNDRNFALVFISSINAYAAETYELNTKSYILKPINKNIITSILKKCSLL